MPKIIANARAITKAINGMPAVYRIAPKLDAISTQLHSLPADAPVTPNCTSLTGLGTPRSKGPRPGPSPRYKDRRVVKDHRPRTRAPGRRVSAHPGDGPWRGPRRQGRPAQHRPCGQDRSSPRGRPQSASRSRPLAAWGTGGSGRQTWRPSPSVFRGNSP